MKGEQRKTTEEKVCGVMEGDDWDKNGEAGKRKFEESSVTPFSLPSELLLPFGGVIYIEPNFDSAFKLNADQNP